MPSSKLCLSNVPAGAIYAVQISRVENGWIAQHLAEKEEDSGFVVTYTTVHADPETLSTVSQEESLADCLRASFDDQRRSKRRGGVVVTCYDTGYENDSTDHTSDKYVFYDVKKPVELPGVTIVPNGTIVDTNSSKPTFTLQELQDILNATRRP